MQPCCNTLLPIYTPPQQTDTSAHLQEARSGAGVVNSRTIELPRPHVNAAGEDEVSIPIPACAAAAALSLVLRQLGKNPRPWPCGHTGRWISHRRRLAKSLAVVPGLCLTPESCIRLLGGGAATRPAASIAAGRRPCHQNREACYVREGGTGTRLPARARCNRMPPPPIVRALWGR